MKKLSIVCLAVVMAVVFGYGSAFAEASAKVTAKCGDVSVIPMATNPFDYTTIFTQTIKTAQQKDLIITTSLECGLTTNTKAASRELIKATADTEAVIMVRVLVDGKAALPGKTGETTIPNGDPVMIDDPSNPGTDIQKVDVDGNPLYNNNGGIVFARRHQTLIAEFQGSLLDCIDDEGHVVLIDADEDGYWDCILPETVQLILDTMQANSFQFIALDLLADTHIIEVQAKLIYVDGDAEQIYNTAETGAMSNAYLGRGTVTIEEVRMIKDDDVEI